VQHARRIPVPADETTKALLCVLTGVAATFAGLAAAQDVAGALTANGKSVELKHAIAREVDSATQKGFMDVIVLLSDRKLAPGDARDIERLETLARRGELAGLVVRLDPDAKVMSAEPLHQAFTTFVFSAPITLDPGAKTVPKQ
jgi:hypothetical protein